MVKPTLARGMRDFSPKEIETREYIFDEIRKACKKYGYQQLDTPVIEPLSILLQKYGEEGDKLVFKVLNSGEYLKDVNEEALQQKDHRKITSAITEKGLRYDLTVPLARYVVMNRNDIALPFKRFQIGKVWRADKPQKGRYREFYQCDADAIGSTSFLYDAECVALMSEVLTNLNMPPFVVKINNRKILAGLAEIWGFGEKLTEFTVAIDKWDKIGENGVVRELGTRGFSETQIHRVQSLFRLEGDTKQKITTIKDWLKDSEIGTKGVQELEQVLTYLSAIEQVDPGRAETGKVEVDFTLARGLDYYTATIFECVLPDHNIGTIAAGGRYDELTASFGVKDMPGVGFSFGAERIFDVLKELDRLPGLHNAPVPLLILNLGGDDEIYSFGIMQKLHREDVPAEMYPNAAKIGKQLQFAEKKGIPYALIIGEEERKSDTFSLKDLKTGGQRTISWTELVNFLNSHPEI